MSVDPCSEITPARSFGRYVLYAPIARGGMATIHLARLIGAEGFSRLVAAKRLHPQLAEDAEVVTMFHDEARIASRIRHSNVVPVLDVVVEGGEAILVQEYVHGVPLDKLFKASHAEGNRIPAPIAVAIVAAVLAGLHAAHETRDETGEPLHIVHRDVSPQNVIVGVDGIPRLVDFGIAKARSCVHVTREGLFKGKLAYMAPEQIRAEEVTRTADVYGAGVLLWELLVLRRLHAGRHDLEILTSVVTGKVLGPSVALAEMGTEVRDDDQRLLVALEPLVMRALALAPKDRFATAKEMLDRLLATSPTASAGQVAEWVRERGADYLERRQKVLSSIEERWYSLSRVAALVCETPTSGVQPVARPEISDAGPVPPSAPPPAASQVPAVLAEPSFRAGVLTWAQAAALLVGAGSILGLVGGLLLAGRAPEPHTVTPAPSTAPVVAVPAAAPPPLTGVPPQATLDPPSQPSVSAAKSHLPTSTALPFRKALSPGPKAQSGGAFREAPGPSAAASDAPGTAGKIDCDPPFYFDGAKKLFKPGCV